MATEKKPLTREFLVERDLRIFKMRQAGVASNEIARRFGMTTSAVGVAIRRQLEKLNKEALMAYPEVLRMDSMHCNSRCGL
jgi:transcriptional regulator